VNEDTYEVEFEEDAWDFLETLQDRQRLLIEKVIEALELDPHPRGCTKLKARKTVQGFDIWRIRKGGYRILYTIEDKVLMVVVVKIDKRSDAYKIK
jgi:mRNA interferase RelE/StbE